MITAATRTAQYIAQAGGPATWLRASSPCTLARAPKKWIDAGLNLYKIVDAFPFYQLTNNKRVLKTLAQISPC